MRTPDSLGSKKCSKCGELRPLTEYYKSGSGLRSECKSCNRGYWQSPRGRLRHRVASENYYYLHRYEVIARVSTYNLKKKLIAQLGYWPEENKPDFTPWDAMFSKIRKEAA